MSKKPTELISARMDWQICTKMLSRCFPHLSIWSSFSLHSSLWWGEEGVWRNKIFLFFTEKKAFSHCAVWHITSWNPLNVSSLYFYFLCYKTFFQQKWHVSDLWCSFPSQLNFYDAELLPVQRGWSRDGPFLTCSLCCAICIQKEKSEF